VAQPEGRLDESGTSGFVGDLRLAIHSSTPGGALALALALALAKGLNTTPRIGREAADAGTTPSASPAPTTAIRALWLTASCSLEGTTAFWANQRMKRSCT